MKIRKVSFWFIALFIILAGYFRLSGSFIAILFSYLVLDELRRHVRRPAVAILIYVLIVVGFFTSFVYAAREAMESLPDVADRSIPVLVDFATRHGVELPFTNTESFKMELVRGIRSELSVFLSSAELLTRQFIVLFLALVIAVSLFANPVLDLKEGKYEIADNLYTGLCREISTRFSNFYRSFRIVLGVQIIISAINTAFTSIFVIAEDLPHRFLLIVATFVCGLFPIIGNIMSNTIIVCVALTISLGKAAWALAFLVVIHKLEYFLNSKIIGERIKNPMWLTLAALIIGEVVMGIPGMILAPVVLYYIKNELSRISVSEVESGA